MDLMGKERGRGGNGRAMSGQRRHGPGTMIPCALATAANAEKTEIRRKSRISFVGDGI
jgi:hypothetical protein